MPRDGTLKTKEKEHTGEQKLNLNLLDQNVKRDETDRTFSKYNRDTLFHKHLFKYK